MRSNCVNMSMCTIGHKNRQKGTNYKKKGREKLYRAAGMSKFLVGTLYYKADV